MSNREEKVIEMNEISESRGGITFHMEDDDDVDLSGVTVVPATASATSTISSSASSASSPPRVTETSTPAPAPAPAAAEAGHGGEGQLTDEEVATYVVNGERPVQFLSFDELAKKFETTVNFAEPKKSPGLTAAEAARRLVTNGPNELTPPKELPEVIKYILNYFDPLMLVLQAAAWLAIIAYLLDTSATLNMWLGIVIFIAVFISTTFSYVLEGRASAVMKGFKNMLPKFAEVIRDGQQKRISAAELVVGDMVVVSTGDQVPADIRVIYSADLKVEKSSLTGESLPISVVPFSKEKRAEDAKNIIMNSSNVLEGSAVGIVFATGDNTFIGRIAKLASSTGHAETPVQKEVKLFVQKQSAVALSLGCIFFIISMSRGATFINAFINSFILVMIACVPEGLPVTITSCLAMAAKTMAEKHVFIKQLRSVETLGSATVIASDKTGTLTQNKMTVSHLWFDNVAWNNDQVRADFPRLLSSQTYNSPPTVAGLAMVGSHYSSYNALELVISCCSKARYEDQQDLTDEQALFQERSMLLQTIQDNSMTLGGFRSHPLLADLMGNNSLTLRGAMAQLIPAKKPGEREIKGDASETALFKFVEQRQNIELMRYHYKPVFEIPFNSRNKYALSIVKPHRVKHVVKLPNGQTEATNYTRRILLMKGAPEVIIKRCSHHLVDQKSVPIDASFTESFDHAYKLFGSQGERVLGFAWLELDEKAYPPSMDNEYNVDKGNYPQTGLTFVGLVSLVDPPKVTVPNAVKNVRGAGLRVIMVTGDHPITAASIARKVGIISPDSMTRADVAEFRNIPESQVPVDDEDVTAEVVVGTSLDSFKQPDWDRLLAKREIVFARTTPNQKLQIVENLQRLGEIVAVTGDGVNDSPALKKADIGVAMGINGSDVARDAAHVILMDDDFSSIVEGVRLGRTIFDNLSKTIAYTLSHTFPETFPVLISLIFDLPFTLTTLSIIAIDCGTELLPAIAYATEPSESDVMNRKPRNPKTDRLVSLKMVMYVIFQSGLITCAWSYMAFCLVFKYYDIPLSRLPWSTDKFWKTDGDPMFIGADAGCSMTVGDPTYSPSCRIISPNRQYDIYLEASGAYWFTLIMSQLGHVWLCKTRSINLWQHGLFNNPFMVYGVMFSLALTFFFIFTPKLNELLAGKPFPPAYWFIFLLAWATQFIQSEGRKWWSRKHPRGWIDRNVNW